MNTNENENVRVCSICGCCEGDEALYEIDGELYCEQCAWDNDYERCEDCGEWRSVYDLTTAHRRYGDSLVCDDCLGDYYFQCSHCDDWYDNRAFSSYTIYNGEHICEDCRSNFYAVCYDCGELYPDSDLYWNERLQEYLCDDCERNGNHNCINSYSYRPTPIFFGITGRPTANDPLTFGVELEVDDGDSSDENDCASDIASNFPDTVYMKDDSSVQFEIVTHPCTLDYHCNEFNWDDLTEIPKSYGFKSHNTGSCGLHIHVGRTQLGDDGATSARIALLMYRFREALLKFSRRAEYQLNRWARFPTFDFNFDGMTERNLMRAVSEKISNGNRYQALNMCNSSTIEFRLWRGTLLPNTILATLQLTSNLCLFARDESLERVLSCSWLDVARYNEYPELNNYLHEKSLDDETSSFVQPAAVPKIVQAPPAKFKSGDVVYISGRQSVHMHTGVFGMVATVIRTLDYGEFPDDREPSYLVQFADFEPEKTNYGYDYDGHQFCYKVPESRLTLADEDYIANRKPLSIGDRVDTYLGKGEIVCLSDYPLRYGVRIDADQTFALNQDGHGLDGFLLGEDATRGWWFDRNELTPITVVA